ncbi:hypothetical protein GCM10009530_41610 [Microbispora corallina]|uniref:Uncharacterized protein n=1 Tax=Microbispora corallina TaxID=83302 RepID=A0ABQ4G1K6_9ACTN|nr:hypothetical protein Mco01_39100 [Microbispora corallina]
MPAIMGVHDRCGDGAPARSGDPVSRDVRPSRSWSAGGGAVPEGRDGTRGAGTSGAFGTGGVTDIPCGAAERAAPGWRSSR